MVTRAFILMCLLLAQVSGLAARPKAAKRKEAPCSKPPELVSKKPLPKEEQEAKKKGVRLQGSVAIEISEAGDVVRARVVRPSSDETAHLLVDLAKGMKFKPRSGCGPFETTVNFNLE